MVRRSKVATLATPQQATRKRRKPKPPAPAAQLPRVPICQQPAEVEEEWWGRVFAERVIPDPASEGTTHDLK